MSQAELARCMKISKQALYHIESHKTLDPRVLTIKAPADVLTVSVDTLVEKGDEKSDFAPAAVALVGAELQGDRRGCVVRSNQASLA